MTLFNNSSVACIKRRLFLLFMLNLSDWLCTLALISTGYFAEANPLMRNVVESPFLGFLVKFALPLGLILFAVRKIKFAEPKQIAISNNIVLAGVAIYVMINLYHLFCFSIVFLYFGF